MSTSIISATATVGHGSRVGEFCVIEDRVKIGEGCVIGHHVVIHDGSIIADRVRIDDGAVIGKRPMRAVNSAVTQEKELSPASIGPDCMIGAQVVIYRGCAIGQKVLVADLASIREDVIIGDFTIVGRGVAIENRCTVGRHVKIETNAYITTYSEIGDRAFVAPCVATSNDNYVGRSEVRFKHFRGVTVKAGGRIGVNATILPGITIERDALVAAGALVTRDVPERKVVAGVPAKTFRDVPDDQTIDTQGWKE